MKGILRCGVNTHIVHLGLISFYTFSGVILMTAPEDGERKISLERDTLGENLSLRDIWGFKLFPHVYHIFDMENYSFILSLRIHVCKSAKITFPS